MKWARPARCCAAAGRRARFKYGVIIKVEGFAAKNGKAFANATNITMPDGTKIFTGTEEPRR